MKTDTIASLTDTFSMALSSPDGQDQHYQMHLLIFYLENNRRNGLEELCMMELPLPKPSGLLLKMLG